MEGFDFVEMIAGIIEKAGSKGAADDFREWMAKPENQDKIALYIKDYQDFTAAGGDFSKITKDDIYNYTKLREGQEAADGFAGWAADKSMEDIVKIGMDYYTQYAAPFIEALG